ncbi:MAG: translation elongation factor-like protein [Candidatus Omnitrophica bacterium]|nr:translation elongation factor-like protein [Candidatus Omnitrophota bacterium]
MGVVTHYFPKVKAGVVKVMGEPIKIGDRIHIKGHTTDFKQKVTSIQINNKSVLKAQKSEEIGILVKSRVRIKDIVYKIDTDKNKGDNYEQKKSKK